MPHRLQKREAELYAHTAPGLPREEWQPLAEHLRTVAELARGLRGNVRRRSGGTPLYGKCLAQGRFKMTEYFWAKKRRDGLPGKSVISHMRDVKAVAESILGEYQSLISRYACEQDQLAFLAGLHDIGKISPGFQIKNPGWLAQSGLEKEAKINCWDTLHETDHTKLTQYTLQRYFENLGLDQRSSAWWALIAGAHHGRVHQPELKLPRGCKSDDEWTKQRLETITKFLGGTSQLPSLSIDDSWPLLWWTAGLISVSDWIGSNEDFFPPGGETDQDESHKIAVNALQTIGFDAMEIKRQLSFDHIFRFSPNDLQTKAAESVQKPGLYVIEAPMGMGKTEAALWAAYQLMQKGLASGIYFALPTQTTSNRIYRRIAEFASKITGSELIKPRLVHAGSWLMDNTNIPVLRAATEDEREATCDAVDWFASKKRALLAPLGVGTVDQALMAVIAVKHFFVRQFALSRKVVILDEIHSYDLYTGTLIKALCDRLIPLGCTILILSATLTGEKKRQLMQKKFVCNTDDVYPLISGEGLAIPVNSPEAKTINVVPKKISEALPDAFKAAAKGAGILWICNTVNRSQEIFAEALRQNPEEIQSALLHARFPVFRRQELEDYWMEKLGKGEKNRTGCILFSTQVVEQSVDLDADLIISELAPTDMLLQRIGRLWRHNRGKRPLPAPELWLLSESYSISEFKKASAGRIKEMLGTKAYVYTPYVLLRSLEIWRRRSSLNLPGDIRLLLKETYSDRTGEPKGWRELQQEMQGKAGALKQFASFETNFWQHLLPDEEGRARTRISDIPTTQLILAQNRDGNRITLLNGEKVTLRGNTFVLASARAIHRNIVKVPEYYFLRTPDNKTVRSLVRGDWQFGVVRCDGYVECSRLKPEYTLRYTPETGVEVIRTKPKDEVDDESCD